MSYVRFYRMTARDGEIKALRQGLEVLAAKVTPLAGCQGVELLQDLASPEQFTFIERWHSAKAHKEGGAALGKEAFAPVMATLAGAPELAALVPIPIA